MKKFDLSNDLFGDDVTTLSEIFDSLRNSSFVTDFKMYPSEYELKEKDGKYEVTVDYNEDGDQINVKCDKDNHTVTVTVHTDLDKTHSNCVCSYYGKYVMTAPEDCDFDTLSKSLDKNNKQMTITFKKIEDKKEEAECVCKKEDAGVYWRNLYLNKCKEYNELLKKYNKCVDELEDVSGKYIALDKKMFEIKKLFSIK